MVKTYIFFTKHTSWLLEGKIIARAINITWILWKDASLLSKPLYVFDAPFSYITPCNHVFRKPNSSQSYAILCFLLDFWLQEDPWHLFGPFLLKGVSNGLWFEYIMFMKSFVSGVCLLDTPNLPLQYLIRTYGLTENMIYIIKQNLLSSGWRGDAKVVWQGGCIHITFSSYFGMLSFMNQTE